MKVASVKHKAKPKTVDLGTLKKISSDTVDKADSGTKAADPSAALTGEDPELEEDADYCKPEDIKLSEMGLVQDEAMGASVETEIVKAKVSNPYVLCSPAHPQPPFKQTRGSDGLALPQAPPMPMVGGEVVVGAERPKDEIAEGTLDSGESPTKPQAPAATVPAPAANVAVNASEDSLKVPVKEPETSDQSKGPSSLAEIDKRIVACTKLLGERQERLSKQLLLGSVVSPPEEKEVEKLSEMLKILRSRRRLCAPRSGTLSSPYSVTLWATTSL